MAFTKGQNYRYSEIENKTESEIEEYGRYACGEQFLIIEIGNTTFSFVLTGTQGSESIYECIYAA